MIGKTNAAAANVKVFEGTCNGGSSQTIRTLGFKPDAITFWADTADNKAYQFGVNFTYATSVTGRFVDNKNQAWLSTVQQLSDGFTVNISTGTYRVRYLAVKYTQD